MDTTTVENINLEKTPIRALRLKVRMKLACMLNKRKLILSPEGLCRDYRGLAELMELRDIDNCWIPDNNNPMASLLERSRHSLADLQEFLKRIDRFDVLDDTRALFYEDAIAYREQENQIASPLLSQNEKDFLTIDDIMESKITYDAFLLYVDADIEFAAEIVSTLESQYNLKICVKDRLLGGAIFEHSAIMKLISERCRRLIVLLSDEFVRSDKDTFFLEFAQFLSLEKENKRRFIIPVKYKCCNLPGHYLVYFILDHMRHGMIASFWEKLNASIVPPTEGSSISARMTELPQRTKPDSTLKCIQDVSSMTTKLQPMPECSLNIPVVETDPSKEIQTTSSTKLLSIPTETVPNISRHKSMKSKLRILFKKISRSKSKTSA